MAAQNEQGTDVAQRSAPTIELRAISKSFGQSHVLRDVDFAVRPGEVLCLLGDNGAGKSTLIKILSGVHAYTSGSMLVNGQEVRFRSPREAKAHGIATVHQEGDTFPLMPVWQNFFLGNELTSGKRPFRQMQIRWMRQIAAERLRDMGIRRVLDAAQLVGTMSGGERQALAISRALYFEGRVLILDEPTSALGVAEAEVVLRAVEAAREAGAAVLLVTHNLRDAVRVGDFFVVLHQGTVAARFARGERSEFEMFELMSGNG